MPIGEDGTVVHPTTGIVLPDKFDPKTGRKIDPRTDKPVPPPFDEKTSRPINPETGEVFPINSKGKPYDP